MGSLFGARTMAETLFNAHSLMSRRTRTVWPEPEPAKITVWRRRSAPWDGEVAWDGVGTKTRSKHPGVVARRDARRCPLAGHLGRHRRGLQPDAQ